LRSRTGCAVVTLCILCFCAASSFASDLLVRSWSPGSDVRQQSIRAILQTRDGYLWAGTGKGLMRFDGVSFTAFTADNTAGMTGDDISFNTLWEDNSGVLWAGTYGQGLIRNDHGHFSTFGKEQGLSDLNVLRIDGDQEGGVWIFTSEGVCVWRNGRLEKVDPGRGGLLIRHDNRRTIDFDKMGLWRHSPVGIERFSYGAWRSFATPTGESLPFEQNVRSVYEDHLHRVWYSLHSQPGRYYSVLNGKLTTYTGLPPDTFVTYQDRAGFLWMNDHGAHPARWKDGQTYPLPDLHTPFLLNVLEGDDGIIWVGSFYTDLFQYRPRLIDSIPTAGIPETGSVLFRQRNGSIWAAGNDLLKLRTAPAGSSSAVLQRPRSLGPREWGHISTLSEDREGQLLIGSIRQPGAQVLKDGKLSPYLIRGVDNSTIQALLLSSSRDQWIATDTGLFRSGEHSRDLPVRLWSGGAVGCLAETKFHEIWACTNQGVIRFAEGQEVPLPETAPWTYGGVYGITVDRVGEVWIATSEHGIVRFGEGRVQAFGTADGLPTNTAYSVDVGDDDDLWIRSDVGLLRIRRRSIDSYKPGVAGKLQVVLFGKEDGLPATNMQPAGNQGFLRFDDGTLWFATTGGIASLRPAEFPYKSGSPRAILEEHVIDQSARMPGSTISLSPAQSNLELHYTALGSSRPEQLTFRYRLRGFDHGWIFAGTRRVAYYTQLPPGSYSFEVQAAEGDDDKWSPAGALAHIQVLTPFYRAWWFLLLLFLGFGSLLAYRVDLRRQRQLTDRRNRQMFTHRLITTQEGERKRIAHELHDSIGQHLVLIRTLAMLPPGSSSSSSGGHLESIAEQAAVAIKEVETISYDLRPYQLDRLGLTKAVLSLIASFERSSTVRIECSVDNIDDFFPKEIEINFYRIVQEALGNVLRHAEATSASLTVTRTGASLRLILQDNGRGFAATGEGKGSGLGLIGIQERAEALPGYATIASVPGQGTTVTVEATQIPRQG
jgi:signal transduction histidine kinase/ligand-binding sensor domain-containing protein